MVQKVLVVFDSIEVNVHYGLVNKAGEQTFALFMTSSLIQDLEWNVDVTYSRLLEFEKTVRKSSIISFVTTEFPKYKLKFNWISSLSVDALEKERWAITIWFREIITNGDMVPDNVFGDFLDLIQVPKSSNIQVVKRAVLEAANKMSILNSVVVLPASSTNLANMMNTSAGINKNEVLKKKKKASPIFVTMHKIMDMLHQNMVNFLKKETVAICVSRNDNIFSDEDSLDMITLFRRLEDFGIIIGLLWSFAVVLVCLYTSSYRVMVFKLLVVSIVFYVIIWYQEQYENWKRYEELDIDKSTQKIQKQLRKSFNQPNISYIPASDYLLFQKLAKNNKGAISAAQLAYSKTSILKATNGAGSPNEKVKKNPVDVIPPHPSSPNQKKGIRNSFSKIASFTMHKSDEDKRTLSTPDKELNKFNLREVETSVSKENAGSLSGLKSRLSISGWSKVRQSVKTKEVHSLAEEKKLVAREDKIVQETLQIKEEKFSMNKANDDHEEKIKEWKAFDEFSFADQTEVERKMSLELGRTHDFKLRGQNYLQDQVKVHPGNSLARLMGMEIYEVDPKDGDRHDHVVSRGQAKKRLESISNLPGNPFQFVVNYQIPGDPPVSIVAFFALPPSVLERHPGLENERFMKLFEKFIDLPQTEEERLALWGIYEPKCPTASNERKTESETENETEDSEKDSSIAAPAKAKAAGNSWLKVPSDISWPDPYEPGVLPQSDLRNLRFKLIPGVADGPWVVRAVLRPKPALLGRKVVQRYFRGPGYMEIDVHVGSSSIASQIVGVTRGYSKYASYDVGITIQGEDPSELPEKLLGAMVFNKTDCDCRRKLD